MASTSSAVGARAAVALGVGRQRRAGDRAQTGQPGGRRCGASRSALWRCRGRCVGDTWAARRRRRVPGRGLFVGGGRHARRGVEFALELARGCVLRALRGLPGGIPSRGRRALLGRLERVSPVNGGRGVGVRRRAGRPLRGRGSCRGMDKRSLVGAPCSSGRARRRGRARVPRGLARVSGRQWTNGGRRGSRARCRGARQQGRAYVGRGGARVRLRRSGAPSRRLDTAVRRAVGRPSRWSAARRTEMGCAGVRAAGGGVRGVLGRFRLCEDSLCGDSRGPHLLLPTGSGVHEIGSTPSRPAPARRIKGRRRRTRRRTWMTEPG